MIRYGNQEPTFSTVGTFAHSLGKKAVRFFEKIGATFYPCQKYEMELFLALNESKRFACRTICISKPRQNGKSYSARFYSVEKAVIEGKRVLYSAHHGKTTREMFNAIKDFVFMNPCLAKKLKPGSDGIRKAAGLEGFYFTNGGAIEFQTRTNSGGRGVTYDVIVVDEAQELTDEQLDAIKPTTIASESGDPQMIYLGTPPNAKCIGTVFRDYHRKAHSGDCEGIWWIEWAVDELPDMSDRLAVLELAYMTNPAMGYRIQEDVMLDVIDTATSVDGFSREYLGWWSNVDIAADTVISADEWAACKVEDPKRDGMLVYAVKFSPDGAVGALAACYKPENSLPFVYVIDSRSLSHGIGWFVDNLAPRAGKAAQIVIDGQSNAQNLNERLLAEGVPAKTIIRPKTQDVIAASATLVNAVREQQITHYGQPALDDSATKSKRRRIGANGGFGFASTDDADATLIESCALAYWGAMTTKRKPGRKAVVF